MAKTRLKDPLAEHMIREIASEAETESRNLLRHICAVYRVDANRNPEQFGSGVFLAVGEKHFFLTAAHVLDDNAESTLYIPSKSGELVVLEGESFRSAVDGKKRDNDLTDVGVVVLKADLVERVGAESFLPVSMVDVDDVGKSGATYIAMGYPAKKNEKLNQTKKTLKRRPASYTANILPVENLAKIGVHRGSHILIGYKKRHSRDNSGKDITAPHPHGMSGGPLWRFEIYSSPSASRLVGILIEWKKELGGILAVRLPVVLAGIAHQYPELDQFIPKTKTVQVTVIPPAGPES